MKILKFRECLYNNIFHFNDKYFKIYAEIFIINFLSNLEYVGLTVDTKIACY